VFVTQADIATSPAANVFVTQADIATSASPATDVLVTQAEIATSPVSDVSDVSDVSEDSVTSPAASPATDVLVTQAEMATSPAADVFVTQADSATSPAADVFTTQAAAATTGVIVYPLLLPMPLPSDCSGSSALGTPNCGMPFALGAPASPASPASPACQPASLTSLASLASLTSLPPSPPCRPQQPASLSTSQLASLPACQPASPPARQPAGVSPLPLPLALPLPLQSDCGCPTMGTSDHGRSSALGMSACGSALGTSGCSSSSAIGRWDWVRSSVLGPSDHSRSSSLGTSDCVRPSGWDLIRSAAMGTSNYCRPSALGTSACGSSSAMGRWDWIRPCAIGTLDNGRPSALSDSSRPSAIGTSDHGRPSAIGTSDCGCPFTIGTSDSSRPSALGTLDLGCPSAMGRCDCVRSSALRTSNYGRLSLRQSNSGHPSFGTLGQADWPRTIDLVLPPKSGRTIPATRAPQPSDNKCTARLCFIFNFVAAGASGVGFVMAVLALFKPLQADDSLPGTTREQTDFDNFLAGHTAMSFWQLSFAQGFAWEVGTWGKWKWPAQWIFSAIFMLLTACVGGFPPIGNAIAAISVTTSCFRGGCVSHTIAILVGCCYVLSTFFATVYFIYRNPLDHSSEPCIERVTSVKYCLSEILDAQKSPIGPCFGAEQCDGIGFGVNGRLSDLLDLLSEQLTLPPR